MQNDQKMSAMIKSPLLKEFLGISTLVWIAGAAYVILIFVAWKQLGEPSQSISEWGQFGDYLGGLLNPTIGLITIVLLSLTLKQNDLALGQAAEELTATRDALKRGQDIQKLTEEALAQQVEIARAERDFNLAVSIAGMYDKKFNELENFLNVTQNIGVVQREQLEKKLSLILLKRNAIQDSLDNTFDQILDDLSLRYGTSARLKAYAPIPYADYSYKMLFDSANMWIDAYVYAPDGQSYYFRLTHDGVVLASNLLVSRFQWVAAIEPMIQTVIMNHKKNAIWPSDNFATFKMSPSNGGVSFKYRFPGGELI